MRVSDRQEDIPKWHVLLLCHQLFLKPFETGTFLFSRVLRAKSDLRLCHTLNGVKIEGIYNTTFHGRKGCKNY